MQRPVLRGHLVLDPDRAGGAAERSARPPVRAHSKLAATTPRERASSAVATSAAGARSVSCSRSSDL